MIFGVGQLFAYQYSNLIEEDQEIVVPEGKIQFPCLDGEAFYVYVKELDTFQDDYASQIALSCGSLQEGTNKIVVPLVENSKFLSNLYQVIVNNIFTEFRFLEEVVEEAALYQITLDVKKGCEELNLVDESIELPGKL